MKEINQHGGFCKGAGICGERNMQLLDPSEQDESKRQRKYDERESGCALTP